MQGWLKARETVKLYKVDVNLKSMNETPVDEAPVCDRLNESY